MKLRTKENKSDSGVGKGHKDKEKELTIEEEVMEKDFSIHQKSSGNKDILVSSTPKKVENNKAKKSDTKVEMLSCNKCNYESKRESTLKKHIITKHEDHICKEFDKNLPTFKDLLKHIADHHCKEIKDNDMKDQSESKVDEEEEQLLDTEKKTREKRFVFSESMLDEFIQ